MNYIDLNSSFRVHGFADYWSMGEAKLKMSRIVIAKEFTQVREIEAKHYVTSVGDGEYKNYLRHNTTDLKGSGLASLKTALQVLYKLNGYSAKFIIIERLY